MPDRSAGCALTFLSHDDATTHRIDGGGVSSSPGRLAFFLSHATSGSVVKRAMMKIATA
jgi:hypothetical protein